MTKHERRKFKKQKRRQERIRQQRNRAKYVVKKRSIFDGMWYPLPSSYAMTGLLEMLMVMAVIESRRKL